MGLSAPASSLIFDALQLCCSYAVGVCSTVVGGHLSSVHQLHLSVRYECIVAKRCEIGPRLLLITNSKSHIGFQMIRKSSTLDGHEGQYCNRNCIDCSASSLAIAWFSC